MINNIEWKNPLNESITALPEICSHVLKSRNSSHTNLRARSLSYLLFFPLLLIVVVNCNYIFFLIIIIFKTYILLNPWMLWLKVPLSNKYKILISHIHRSKNEFWEESLFALALINLEFQFFIGKHLHSKPAWCQIKGADR